MRAFKLCPNSFSPSLSPLTKKRREMKENGPNPKRIYSATYLRTRTRTNRTHPAHVYSVQRCSLSNVVCPFPLVFCKVKTRHILDSIRALYFVHNQYKWAEFVSSSSNYQNVREELVAPAHLLLSPVPRTFCKVAGFPVHFVLKGGPRTMQKHHLAPISRTVHSVIVYLGESGLERVLGNLERGVESTLAVYSTCGGWPWSDQEHQIFVG